MSYTTETIAKCHYSLYYTESRKSFEHDVMIYSTHMWIFRRESLVSLEEWPMLVDTILMHVYASKLDLIGYKKIYKSRTWVFEGIKKRLGQSGTRHMCREWIRSIYILNIYEILSVNKMLYKNKSQHHCHEHKI